MNTCQNSFFGPHLGLGRQKNVIRLGQTPDVVLSHGKGGAARFFLRLIVASGLVSLYSLVWRCPFGNKFLIIQKKKKGWLLDL